MTPSQVRVGGGKKAASISSVRPRWRAGRGRGDGRAAAPGPSAGCVRACVSARPCVRACVTARPCVRVRTVKGRLVPSEAGLARSGAAGRLPGRAAPQARRRRRLLRCSPLFLVGGAGSRPVSESTCLVGLGDRISEISPHRRASWRSRRKCGGLMLGARTTPAGPECPRGGTRAASLTDLTRWRRRFPFSLCVLPVVPCLTLPQAFL